MRATRSDAEIEADLDELDAALANDDDERATAALDSLRPVRRSVPELLARRLIAGRAQRPFFLLDLIAEWADRRVVPIMDRISRADETPPVIRFGAQRHAGWFLDEAAERRAFLESLPDAGATLVDAVRHAVDVWPPNGEVLDEVHRSLHALPADQARTVVERIANELGADARWLLHALLHEETRDLREPALAALVWLRPPGGVAPVDRLHRTASDRRARREAEDALRRLREQSPSASAGRTMPPLLQVKATPFDAFGSQALVVARRAEAGLVTFAIFLCEEGEGPSIALAMRYATPERLAAAEARLTGNEIPLVEIDLAAARGLVAAVLEPVAGETPSVSPEFELWEPLLHDHIPPSVEPPSVVALDDAPYALRADLLPRTDALLDHPAFAAWTFEPGATLAAMEQVRPPAGGLWTDEQYRPLIRALATPEEREWLRRILRRQSWLLDRSGDADARDLALATAAALHHAMPDALVALPFLRAMARRSADIVVAQLALEEQLDALLQSGLGKGGFGALPPFGPARAKPRRKR